MSAGDQRAKSQAMAADLVKRGYYHGRRFSKGLSNVPENEPGSAAYRRLVKAKRGGHRVSALVFLCLILSPFFHGAKPPTYHPAPVTRYVCGVGPGPNFSQLCRPVIANPVTPHR